MALNPPVRSWHGERCWIVGASSGIGEALAIELARHGARVALSARREGALAELASRLAPSESLVLPLDVRDAPAVEGAAARIESAWGGIDLVVVMAGEWKPMRSWEIDVEAARSSIDTNVTGAFHVLAAVVSRMAAAGSGHVALVSSVAGYRGLPKGLVYGATKAALIHMAETLYLDLRPRGVGVSVVNPGFVRTPMTSVNDFPMPAMVEPGEAAREIVHGLERGDFEIHFPRRFTRVLKLLRLLPPRLYFAAVRRATGAR